MKVQARAAIFDLDGTLVDTLERFFEVFNRVLLDRGRPPLPWDEFFRHYLADTLDDVVAPRDSLNREQSLHEFWMAFLWKYREEDPRAKLIPGVKEVFERLHGLGVPVAVITSCIVPVHRLREELDSYGIGKYVEAIATAHDVVRDLERGHHFSKVEIFRLAAKRLGVEPKECVVVGDYWNDIRDGKRVGARTVGVLTGLMRRELLERYKPDAVIPSVREIFEVVEFKALSEQRPKRNDADK